MDDLQSHERRDVFATSALGSPAGLASGMARGAAMSNGRAPSATLKSWSDISICWNSRECRATLAAFRKTMRLAPNHTASSV
ncbi:hypothetical protein [Sphingobium yanoikuyae]|uniref:hypothetical protein n=1 Tax=Sphingobium yanoikuyae TaxID=13690 RepID=UPI00123728B5|nr:hypothetical protein [Sphingobium yanoikuyae]